MKGSKKPIGVKKMVKTIKRQSRELEIPNMRIVPSKKVYSRKVKHQKGDWA